MIVPLPAPGVDRPAGATSHRPGRITIRVKVMSGFLVIIALLAVVGWVGIATFTGISHSARLLGDTIRTVGVARDVDRDVAELRKAVSIYAITSDPHAYDAALAARGRIGERIGAARALPGDGDARQGFADIDRQADGFMKQFDMLGKSLAALKTLIDERMKPTVGTIEARFDEMLKTCTDYYACDETARDQLSAGLQALNRSQLAIVQLTFVGDGTVEAAGRSEIAKLRDILAKLSPLIFDAAAKDTLKRLAEDADRLPGLFDELLALRTRADRAVSQDMAAAADKVTATISGIRDALVAQQDRALEDTESLVSASRRSMTGLAIGGALAGLVLAWLIGTAIVRPVAALTAAMGMLARGNWLVDVPSRTRRDEIGAMARAVERFKENGIENERLRREADHARGRENAHEREAETTRRLAAELEAAVGDVAGSVAQAAISMRETAQHMAGLAAATVRESGAAADAAKRAAVNVGSIAGATEQFSTSAGEIGARIVEASRTAGRAVDEAGKADRIVRGLADEALQIGDVVRLIQAIAQQTHLLALNATIEAARAGGAGQGFAVVAAEVKTLARQTAQATEDIGQLITRVQGRTEEAVGAIARVSDVIRGIDATSGSIAAAIEQQGATTTSIARAVEDAAVGTQTVSENVSRVDGLAADAGDAAGRVVGECGELHHLADQLRHEVSRFLERVRAG